MEDYNFNSKHIKRRKLLNTIGLALLLCANPLSWLYPVENVIVGISFISLLIVIFNNPITVFINRRLLIILGVVLLFIFSFLFGRIEAERFFLYLFSFFVFGFTGILYSSVQFSYENLYKSIFVISVVSLPGVYGISNADYTQSGDVSGFLMGISQGALRLLLGIILVIPFFKNKLLNIFSLLMIIVYTSFYFNYGTRSAILGLFMFFIFFYLIKKDLLTVYAFVLISVLGTILSFFLIDIIILLHNTLEMVDLSIKALDKVVYFAQLDMELSNGRLDIWRYAFDDISNSLVFGNGISVFESTYGVYPHNFLIQILHEGGILYLIPILIVFRRLFKLLFSKCQSKETKLFLIYLFFGGIFELMFSNIYWRNVYFWFFIGYVVSLYSRSIQSQSQSQSQSQYKH